MTDFQTPLYLQRKRCVFVAKASCIKLDSIIQSTSKRKTWRTNFNPHKVDREISRQFVVLSEMITALHKDDIREFRELLLDSHFSRNRILCCKYGESTLTCGKDSVLRRYSDDIMQRMIIIYCILYHYINNNSLN